MHKVESALKAKSRERGRWGKGGGAGRHRAGRERAGRGEGRGEAAEQKVDGVLLPAVAEVVEVVPLARVHAVAQSACHRPLARAREVRLCFFVIICCFVVFCN